jgi:hypothetical protein
VFFPHNKTVRLVYSPLFALYRYDRPAPGRVSHSALWDLVTWRRDVATREREFHVGPLFGAQRRGDEKRYALLGGTLGWERRADGGWRIFAFEYKRRAAPAAASDAVHTPGENP